MTRLLALDVGDERIGIALSDERGELAHPLMVIPRRAGSASFHRIAALLKEHGVGRIVVGLPLLPDGREGRQVASVRAYVRGLQRHVQQTPIIFWDERDSTAEAREVMAAQRPGACSQRGHDDAVAAAVILQRYIAESEGGKET